MMRAALENFRCRIHAEDRKTLERTAETLFIGNDSLWCEVRMLNDLTEGMARENQKLKEAYEKSEAFFKGLMGEKVHKFIPWLMSVALFIGLSNTIGLILEPWSKLPVHDLWC